MANSTDKNEPVYTQRYNCLECTHYRENGWFCPFTACIYPTMNLNITKPGIIPKTAEGVLIKLD